MGAGEHLLEFSGGNPFLQFIVQPSDFGKSFTIFRFRTKFDEDPDVLHLPGKPVPTLNRLFLGGPLLEYSLGGLGIVPEARLGNFSLEFLDILPLTVYVKETPKVWRSVLQGLRFWLILL